MTAPDERHRHKSVSSGNHESHCVKIFDEITIVTVRSACVVFNELHEKNLPCTGRYEARAC
ncbi:hypothetical protein EYF80_020960 [Liparis tanakae]|uniref:Uncharacterized protein n=1 Tax=Liparis tanakae TaxID=230148 RepID=A0A4Z2HV24_9TELE|nr:hypothetical protein EYF80_020960 [Liparis tanakae]